MALDQSPRILRAEDQPSGQSNDQHHLRLNLHMELSDFEGDISNGEWQRKNHLGSGAFGDVFKAQHRLHGKVALKLAKPSARGWIEMYQKEIKRLGDTLLSSNIVSIKGTVQDNNIYGIVMEYMAHGSLWHFRVNKLKMVPDKMFSCLAVLQIAHGLRYLHSFGIIHRDLKLENVLVSIDYNVKIADLGLATNPNTSEGAKEKVGTLSHTPPEAFTLTSSDIVKPKYDVYSLSMTIFELQSGHHPYGDRGEETIRDSKKNDEHVDLSEEVEVKTHVKVLDIMQKGRQFDPRDRPEVKDIIAQLDEIVPSEEAHLDAHHSIFLQINSVTQVDHPSDEVSDDDAELADHFQQLTSRDQPPRYQPPRDQTGADRVSGAVGTGRSLPDKSKGEESPVGAVGVPPTDPDPSDSDEPIILNHLSDEDGTFDITLSILPVFKVQRQIVPGMWTCIDRCRNRSWWSKSQVEQTLNSVGVGLDGIGITLFHLKLPGSDTSPFVLTLRARQGRSLTELKKLCSAGKLCTMLFPCFADEQLHKVCSQAEPTIEVELCSVTYEKGVAFFEKLEKKDGEREEGARKGKSSRTSPTIRSDGDGLHIKTDRAELHLNQLPSNIVVGNQHNYYGSSHMTFKSARHGRHSPASFARIHEQVQCGAQSQQQGRDEPPKLSVSREMVSLDLCQHIMKSVPGNNMKSLGRQLGLNDAQVVNIIFENSQYGVEETVYQILKKWRGQKASGATKAKLARALYDSGCYDAAMEVQ